MESKKKKNGYFRICSELRNGPFTVSFFFLVFPGDRAA